MTRRGDSQLPRAATLALPLRVLRARPWLFGCASLGAALGVAAPGAWQWTTRALCGWDVATLAYFLMVGRMMASADGQTMRQKAQALDEGRVAILAVAVLVTLVSLGAIVLELAFSKDLHGLDKTGHVSLAAVTIVLSWFFIHLIFTLHYANEFFFECDADGDGTPDLRGGLNFPHTHEPAYIDFLYYAYTIGVAAQTADVETTSSTMRGFTLLHSIVSFFFNTVVVALTINIAAGLI